jgi:peptidoglycan/LPS O-acetylase OafA/YrhL
MRRNIPPLTSLRFLAALWVFVFHLYLWSGSKAPGVLNRLLLAGPVGMAFFFVLSGFILAQSSVGADPLGSYRAYAVRRFARIYPIYVAVLLVSWLLVGFAGELGESPVRSGAAHGVADMTLTNAWFPQMFMGGHIRSGTWSLSVEAFFYALFPLIFFHARGMSDRALAQGIRWSVALLCFFSLMGKYVQPVDPAVRFATFYAMPIFRLPEFVAGVFAGVLAGRESYQVPSGRKAALAGAGIFVFIAIFGKSIPEVAQGVVIVPCLLVVFAYFARREDGPAVRFFSHPAFVFLGEASFALYLVQLVTLPLFAAHTGDMARGTAVMLCFFATLLIAALAHLLIERPMRPLVTRWLSPKSEA